MKDNLFTATIVLLVLVLCVILQKKAENEQCRDGSKTYVVFGKVHFCDNWKPKND